MLFVGFLLLKSRVSLRPRDPVRAEATRKIREAKKRARDGAGDDRARLEAWLEASRVALEELGRPRLAGSFAVRAAQIDPDSEEAYALMADSFRDAKRYRALERFLWRRLDGPRGPGYDRAFAELVDLYQGPMHAPERAHALEAMRGRTGGA